MNEAKQNNPVAMKALGEILAGLGLAESAAGGPVSIVGEDFPQVSPHRLASVNAAAMAAHAIAVAALWRERGGEGQSIRVETARALHAIRAYFYMRHNEFPVSVEIMNAVTDFHRSADGRWIYVFGSEHFLSGALEVLQTPNNAAAVRAAIARRQSAELEEAFAERRVPACIVRSEDEWREHPQGRWLAARPLVEIEKIGDSAPQPLPPAGDALSRPLSGLRVLDCAHVICGPMIARFLGEHGADVLRLRGPRRRDSDAVAFDTSWGKRTALVDLKSEAGRATAHGLLEAGDVLVQSYRPGALDRLQLSAAEVATRRPGIVYVSASCYGSGGPWASRGGYDPAAQTVSGMAQDEALEGKPRIARTVTVCDYITAYLGAAGAVVALARRAREGGSWHVKVSLTRSAMWLRRFGTLPGAREHAHLPYADPVAPRLATHATPFGEITALLPAVEFSHTPAYWSRPPQPAGASQPVWLAR